MISHLSVQLRSRTGSREENLPDEKACPTNRHRRARQQHRDYSAPAARGWAKSQENRVAHQSLDPARERIHQRKPQVREIHGSNRYRSDKLEGKNCQLSDDVI